MLVRGHRGDERYKDLEGPLFTVYPRTHTQSCTYGSDECIL